MPRENTGQGMRTVHTTLSGENWERGAISTVWPLSTLSIPKILLKPKDFENAGFRRFYIDGNIFKTKLFEDDSVKIIMLLYWLRFLTA